MGKGGRFFCVGLVQGQYGDFEIKLKCLLGKLSGKSLYYGNEKDELYTLSEFYKNADFEDMEVSQKGEVEDFMAYAFEVKKK